MHWIFSLSFKQANIRERLSEEACQLTTIYDKLKPERIADETEWTGTERCYSVFKKLSMIASQQDALVLNLTTEWGFFV